MPDWSPDGSRIVFASSRQNEKAIYSMNTDGTDLIKLNVSVAEDWFKNHAYSPDGEKIIFATQGLLYIMNVDATEIKVIPCEDINDNPDWF